MDRITRVIQDTEGSVVQGASVSVFVGDSPTLAPLFSDSAGSSGIPNPMTSDLFGAVSFYVADGFYRIQAEVFAGSEVIQLGMTYVRVISPDTVMLRANNGSDIANKAAFLSEIGAAPAGALGDYIPLAEKGAADGVCDLDNNAQIPIERIPQAVQGNAYQGTWDASTGLPPADEPMKGWYWIVNVPGNTNLSGITDWKVHDWAVFNGLSWNKIDNTDQVTSVNGQMGAVSILPGGATGQVPVKTDGANYAFGWLTLGSAATANVGDFDSAGAAAAAETAAKLYVDGLFAALSVDWSQLANVPDTVAGYGITDVYTKDEVDNAFTDAATAASTYTNSKTMTKPEIVALVGIPDPTTATAEDCANAINAIIAALQAA